MNPTQQSVEEDLRVSQMKEQLARKASLFDVLTPPKPKQLNDAATRDAKLQSAIRRGHLNSRVALFMGVVLLIVLIADRSSSEHLMWFVLAMISLSGFGEAAFRAADLLRERVISLEAKIEQPRQPGGSASGVKPDSAPTT